MSSRDCKNQTTNIYNLSKQNHYSTEALTTVNTGMYWYTLIICPTWLYIWVTLGCLMRSRNCLPFASTWVHPRVFVGSVFFIF